MEQRRSGIRSRSVRCSVGHGVTHHAHGVDTVLTIANVALMRGMVGRPGAGLMPLRGHSNIQVLVVARCLNWKSEMLARLEAKLGIAFPKAPGLDTLGSIEHAAAGHFRFAWCLGGNLFGSNPDSQFATQALGQIDFTVYLNTTLNMVTMGRGRETLILPARRATKRRKRQRRNQCSVLCVLVTEDRLDWKGRVRRLRLSPPSACRRSAAATIRPTSEPLAIRISSGRRRGASRST